MKKYYSVKEAAEIIGVSTNTLYKYLDEGKIQSKRIGNGPYKIPASELVPYAEKPLHQKPQEKSESSATSNQGSQQETLQEPEETYSDDQTSAKQSNKLEEQDDSVFFKFFLSIIFLSTGLLTLLYRLSLFTPYEQALPINRPLPTIFLLIPFLTMLPGILFLLNIFSNRIKSGIWILYILPLFVSGYMAYFSFRFQGYEVFAIFTAIFLVLTGKVFERFREYSGPLSFERNFLNVVFLAVLLFAGLIVFVPETFTTLRLDQGVIGKLELFAGTWVLLVGLPLFTLFVPGIKRSVDILVLPYLSLVFVVVGIILSSQVKWLASFYIYLIVVFLIFLLWKRRQDSELTQKFVSKAIYGLSWSSFVVFLGILGIVFSQISALNNYFERVEANLSQTEDEINLLFANADRQLRSELSGLDAVRIIKEEDQSAATELTKRVFDRVPELRRVLVLDKSGVVLGVYPREALLIGTNLGNRGYFMKTKSTLSSQTSDIFIAVTSVPVIVRTYPITENNQFIGLVMIAPDLQGLSKDFNKNADAAFFAYDKERKYVLHPDPYQIGEPVPGHIVKDAESDIHRDVYEYTIFQKLDSTGWTLYQSGPLSSALKPLFGINVAVGFLIFANSLFGFGVLSFISRRQK